MQKKNEFIRLCGERTELRKMCYIHCFHVLLQTKVPKFLGFGIPQTLNRSGQAPRPPTRERLRLKGEACRVKG